MKTEKRKNRKPCPVFSFTLTLFPCSSSAALYHQLAEFIAWSFIYYSLGCFIVSLCVFVFLYLSLLLSASYISFIILLVPYPDYVFTFVYNSTLSNRYFLSFFFFFLLFLLFSFSRRLYVVFPTLSSSIYTRFLWAQLFSMPPSFHAYIEMTCIPNSVESMAPEALVR